METIARYQRVDSWSSTTLINTPRQEADQYWFSHARFIQRATEDYMDNGDPGPLRGMLAARFEAGAKWSLAATVAASPHIADFLHMCTLLGVYDEIVGRLAGAISNEIWNATGGNPPSETSASYQAEPPY